MVGREGSSDTSKEEVSPEEAYNERKIALERVLSDPEHTPIYEMVGCLVLCCHWLRGILPNL